LVASAGARMMEPTNSPRVRVRGMVRVRARGRARGQVRVRVSVRTNSPRAPVEVRVIRRT